MQQKFKTIFGNIAWGFGGFVLGLGFVAFGFAAVEQRSATSPQLMAPSIAIQQANSEANVQPSNADPFKGFSDLEKKEARFSESRVLRSSKKLKKSEQSSRASLPSNQ